MNISNVVTRIKLSLGLMAISTPFENIDEVITTIIDDITLPVFSQYNPVKEIVRFNTTELEMIDKTEQYKIFVLPEFKNRNLLYVFDVRYDDACLSGFGYYGGGMPLMQGNLMNQVMLSNAGAQMMNTMRSLDNSMKQGINVNGQFVQRGSDLVAVVNKTKAQTGADLLSNVSYAR